MHLCGEILMHSSLAPGRLYVRDNQFSTAIESRSDICPFTVTASSISPRKVPHAVFRSGWTYRRSCGVVACICGVPARAKGQWQRPLSGVGRRPAVFLVGRYGLAIDREGISRRSLRSAVSNSLFSEASRPAIQCRSDDRGACRNTGQRRGARTFRRRRLRAAAAPARAGQRLLGRCRLVR